MYCLMRGLLTYSEYNHPTRMMMTNSSKRIAVVLKDGLMWRKPALEVLEILSSAPISVWIAIWAFFPRLLFELKSSDLVSKP